MFLLLLALLAGAGPASGQGQEPEHPPAGTPRESQALLDQALSLDQAARAEAWREIAARGTALLPALVAELRHEDARHRCTAVSAVRALGSAARTAASPLVDLVRGEDAQTSCDPGDALFEVAPEVFAKELRGALGSRDARLCRALVDGLSFHEERVPPVVLDALALDGCRQTAADALSFSTDVRAAPALLRALAGPSREGRLETMEALDSLVSRARVSLKPWVPEVVNALIAALQDENPQIREAAARSLAALGLDAEPAVDALVRALGDPEQRVRWSAVRAIAALGTRARAAGPALLRMRAGLPRAEGQQSLLDQAIEATHAGKDDARLATEDDIRAAVVDHILAQSAAGGRTLHLELVVPGEPEPTGLLRALARRGLKPPPNGGVNLVFGRVEWTALDLVRVAVTFDGGMDSSGTTYVVALWDGRWTVVGTRGGWITDGPRPPGKRHTEGARAACRPEAPWARRAPRSREG